MHARVTKFTLEPGRIDDANEYYRSTVLPQARELAGFKGGVALVDRDGGNIFSFTLWETKRLCEPARRRGIAFAAKRPPTGVSPRPWSSATRWAFSEID